MKTLFTAQYVVAEVIDKADGCVVVVWDKSGRQKKFTSQFTFLDRELRGQGVELDALVVDKNLSIRNLRLIPKPFEPTVTRQYQIEEAKTVLSGIVFKYLTCPVQRNIALKVINTPEFWTAPGGRAQHHDYVGGLAVHTAEVMDYALNCAMVSHSKINLQVLVMSVLYHDFGKIWDYSYNDTGGIEKTEHMDLIYHLPRSYGEWIGVVSNHQHSNELPEGFIDNVSHAILAHHGRREWASPVEPKTPEAYILHCADMMSVNCSQDLYKRSVCESELKTFNQ